MSQLPPDAEASRDGVQQTDQRDSDADYGDRNEKRSVTGIWRPLLHEEHIVIIDCIQKRRLAQFVHLVQEHLADISGGEQGYRWKLLSG